MSELLQREAPAPPIPCEAPAAAAQPPLTLSDVHKRWGPAQPPVLDGVDLVLGAGTKTWIGGRNGAGKTTLLRIAAGLIDADRGDAAAYGIRPARNRSLYQRQVTFLPAGDRGLYARLTVRRQLEFWARIAMVSPDRARRLVEAAIVDFELQELAGRRVDRMSMGQRQRLRIAMTFLAEPDVVLLDEPLTSLDSDGAAVLERAMTTTLAAGGAVLWCSPVGEHVEVEFDARWTLERGRLVPQ